LNIHHDAKIYVSVRNNLGSLPFTYQQLTFTSLFSQAMIIITLAYNVLYSTECGWPSQREKSPWHSRWRSGQNIWVKFIIE